VGEDKLLMLGSMARRFADLIGLGMRITRSRRKIRLVPTHGKSKFHVTIPVDVVEELPSGSMQSLVEPIPGSWIGDPKLIATSRKNKEKLSTKGFAMK
jgi:hypothetical protein